MKNYVFIILSAGMLFTACKNGENGEAVIRERDSLLIAIQEQETLVNVFAKSFNEVEKNLDEVTKKQQLIAISSDKNTDLNADQKSRINEEIKAINALMLSNSRTIKQLKEQLKTSRSNYKELEKNVMYLNGQLNQRYTELAKLNYKLYTMNLEVDELQITIDTLFLLNRQQAQTIEAKDAELRTAYYIIGSSKDLQLWNLIDKEGGWLGIGQSSKISNNVDLNMFTKIDYLQTTIIPINAKHVRIISTHPTGSFSLVKTGKIVNSIVISDPKLFWSISKYLVISK